MADRQSHPELTASTGTDEAPFASEPGDPLFRLLSDVEVRLGRAFDVKARPLGLTRPLWLLLATIHEMPGATQTEVAARLSLGRSPAGKAIDKLERLGLVERRADADDRRVNRLYATRAAEQFIRPGRFILGQLDALVGSVFDESDRADLVRKLARLRAALDAHLDIEHATE